MLVIGSENIMLNIIRLEQVDSTNNYAQQHFAALPDRSLITAQHQTKGKGRGGKTWISLCTSNLYTSYIMKNIPFLPCKASWIGGLAALYTIREIIKQHTLKPLYSSKSHIDIKPQNLLPKAHNKNRLIDTDYWIKWPNDIYHKTKKISGILCESSLGQNNQVNGVIIGIGMNINMSKQELEKIDKPATSILVETGTSTEIESAINILIANLNKLYDEISAGNIDSIFELWKKENALIGNSVEILLDNNVLDAKVLDIENSGQLVVVDKNANIHKIYSGDVSIKNFCIP
jgi:BirA family transcriptional regulator, biotin operon repressor / biotin---[acetyl-CoA-carboxylase] ligase